MGNGPSVRIASLPFYLDARGIATACKATLATPSIYPFVPDTISHPFSCSAGLLFSSLAGFVRLF